MNHKILYILTFLFATLQTFGQTYIYDNNNRLEKVVYGNGVIVKFTYDELGNRLTKTVTGATEQTFTISVSAAPSGSGTVTGGGTYTKGTAIELKAIANDGYEFSKWSDGETDNPRSIVVESDMSLTAQFKKSSACDVNGDGSVTIADVTALVNIIQGKDDVAPYIYDHGTADVNHDGSITTADVIELVNIILGK